MIRRQILKSPGIKINQSTEGEYLELKVKKILTSQEPIEAISPIIYTARKDGVEPQYNIRSDRWDIAIEAMDKVSKSKISKRAEFIKNTQDEIKNENEIIK